MIIKNILPTIFCFFISIALHAQTNQFGDKISTDGTTPTSDLKALYELEEAFDIKFQATVVDVCQMKGCWMKLDLGDNNEVMVNFKDYGFFVPKNISGRAVLVSGKGFKKTISVDELKHYAFDRGDSEDLIAKINEPEIIYALTADGVLLLPMNETE